MALPESVSRRVFLALAGGGLSGLAGCTSAGLENDTPTRTRAADGAPPTEAARAADPATPTDSPTLTPTETATTTDPRTERQTPTPEPEETATPTPTQGASAAIERMQSQLASVEFDGEYVDTHAHWLPAMGPKVPSMYAPLMEQHDIGATVLFSPSARAARSYESFLERLTDPGVEFLPFMSAPPPGRRLARELRALYDEHGAAFWGIGEWKPQNEPFPPFDGERYTPLWELAADLDLPVMFHPKASQEGTVEPALKAHTETTFILHGHQMLGYGKEGPGLGPTLPRLLGKYDNLYWQMDVGVMLSGTLLRLGSADEFVKWYESNADELAGVFQDVLSRLLDAAPERVMWGTDIAQHWNLSEEVFSLIMDFTEQVVGGIPEKHRAPYKRENARRLFDL